MPMAASVVSMTCNLMASMSLVRVLGSRPCAGASLAALANAAVLLAFLRRDWAGSTAGVS